MARKKLSDVEILTREMQKLGLEVPDFSQFEEGRREADAVVLYIENPNLFREVNCHQCSRLFATNHGSVAMCSDSCRRVWLRNVGIEWNLAKSPAERWAGNIPLVCGPESLAVVKEVLQNS